MKKTLTILMTLGLTATAATAIPVDVTTWLTDNQGNQETSALPGSSIQLIVEMTTDISLVSGQMGIQADTSDIFTLESVTFDGINWSSDEFDVLDPSPQLLNAANANTSDDFGTLSQDWAGTPTGQMQFATLTLSIASDSPEAVYQLSLTNPFFGDTNFEEASTLIDSGYQVTVVPEPATLTLAALTGIILIRRR